MHWYRPALNVWILHSLVFTLDFIKSLCFKGSHLSFNYFCKLKWKFCNLLVSIRHYLDIVSKQFYYTLHITYILNTICKRKLISVNNFTWNYNICVQKLLIYITNFPSIVAFNSLKVQSSMFTSYLAPLCVGLPISLASIMWLSILHYVGLNNHVVSGCDHHNTT